MRKALLQLHLAVFLAGFTGILGRLITLNEGLLVWYRMLIASVSLAILLLLRGQLRKVSRRQLIKVAATGGIIALHWVAFFGSIKYANVSIALVCFSATGFFTSFLEPLMLRTRFDRVEVLLGIVVVIGIYLIFNFNPDYKTGIIIGLIAALLAAVFTVINKRLVEQVPVRMIAVVELGGGWLVLTALLPVYFYFFPTPQILPGIEDLGWLLVLAWLCTILAFDLQLNSLKKISTFTNNLTYNLEPIYGIVLAFVFFHENQYLSSGFYVGLAIIIAAVLIQTLRLKQQRDRERRAALQPKTSD